MSRHRVGQYPYGIATSRPPVMTVPSTDAGRAGAVQTKASVSPIFPIVPIAAAVRMPIVGTIGIPQIADGAAPLADDTQLDSRLTITAPQATVAPVHVWEVTIIRRASSSTGAHVVGRVTFAAPDADGARRLAEAALTERRAEARRSGESSVWSLGTLHPLDPGAPGTGRYRVTFTLWESREDRFERRIVHEMELWATNATTARHIAQLNVQSLAHYIGAWRIQGVARIIDDDLA
jgi:hypothetical protein